MAKTKIFCYRIGSNVAVDRARDCLAFDALSSRGRYCGYCKHSQTGDDADCMIIDLDAVYGD